MADKIPPRLEYDVGKLGYAKVNGVGDFDGEILRIPAKLGDIPVYSIGEYAFSDDEKIKLIFLEEGIKAIYSGAFSCCQALKKVYIPSTVSILGDCAFVDSPSITHITFRRNRLITEIARSTFAGVTALTNIELPTNIVNIGEYAFFKCTSLTEINLPDTLERICDCAFAECSSLESIKIPNSVYRIGDDAFGGCESLTEMYFEDPNGWYANGRYISDSILRNPKLAAKLFRDKRTENISFKKVDQSGYI